jgi:hypothetical protein
VIDKGPRPLAAVSQGNISDNQRKIFSGPPCPRCRRPMEIRGHARIREKQRRQPFYYSRWYRCPHTDCPTTLVMPPEFRVFAANEQLRLQV